MKKGRVGDPPYYRRCISLWRSAILERGRRDVGSTLLGEVLIFAAFAATSGEHLVVLGFLDAFQGEAFDGFFLVRAFTEGGFTTADGGRFARIASEGGGGFLIFNRGCGKIGAEEVGASAGDVVVGYVGAGAAVNGSEFAGAADDIGFAEAAGAFAVDEDAARSGVVDIHILFLDLNEPHGDGRSGDFVNQLSMRRSGAPSSGLGRVASEQTPRA